MRRSHRRPRILAAFVLCWWTVEVAHAQEDALPGATATVARRSDEQESPAPPDTPAPEPDPYPDEGPDPSRFLLEDAFGLRSGWDARGVSFFASFTPFQPGVASGGAGRGSIWGGKFEMLAHLDGGKLGLWGGGMLDLYAESRLGGSIDEMAAVYSPTNLAMYFPVPDGQITAITGLKFTQAITERSGIFFGKMNALNGDREKFLKYPLSSRFWNAAFNFNLALDRYPYSTPGAGFYAGVGPKTDVAFLVLDSHDAPRTSGLENLGRNGAFLYAEAKRKTNVFGLPGRHIFAGLFGTGSFTDLAPASFLHLPYDPTPPPRVSGTWAVLWNIEQRLIVDPDDPEHGLGLYIQTGLGDGNPNPVRGFISAALCGNSPLPGRDCDLMGVGYYHLGLSAPFKASFPGLRDEDGVELFYNARVARGCHLTPDLQVVRPGLAPVDAALILGLRLKVDF